MDAEPGLEHLKTECNQLIDRIMKLQAAGRLLDEEIGRLEQQKADMLSGNRPFPAGKSGTDTGKVSSEKAGTEPEETACQKAGNKILDVSGKEPGQTVSTPSLPELEEKLLKEQIAHQSSGKEVVVVYGQTGTAETMDRVLKVILLMAAIILLTAAATAVLYFIQKPDALPVAFRAILDGQWGQ